MDPTNQPVVPPVEIPGQAQVQGQEGVMSQEEMIKNLQEMMSKIEGKYQEFNTHKFSSDNKVKSKQSEMLREVFDLLQSNGIDPNNTEEVGAFLDQLKQANPELYQQFTAALQMLLGDETLASSTPPIPEMGGQQDENIPPTEDTTNMNINTNGTSLQENV